MIISERLEGRMIAATTNTLEKYFDDAVLT